MLRLMAWCVGFALLLVGLWIGLGVVANQLLPSAVDRVAPSVQARLASAGVEVLDWRYEEIKTTGWRHDLVLRGLQAQLRYRQSEGRTVIAQVSVPKVLVGVVHWLQLQAELKVEQVSSEFKRVEEGGSMPFEALNNASLQLPGIGLRDPRATLTTLQQGLTELLRDNATSLPISFSGDVVLRSKGGHVVPARLYSVEENGKVFLRFDQADVQTLSHRMDLRLSPAQVEVAAGYPLRLPTLVDFTEQARELAREHYRYDRWMRDAMRHVAWSFLITQRWGADFAEQVTNAQEAKPGNAPDERRMDYQNNALGRELAQQGVAWEKLPVVVATDARVVRSPAQAQ